MAAGVIAVDRSNPVWRRLRAACADSDEQADRVFVDVCRARGVAFGNTTAAASASLDGTLLAAAARRHVR